MKTFWRARHWGRENIVAASAVTISLCALGVSWYQADIARRSLSAEFWPHVELSLFWSGESYKLIASNVGSGPARIKNIRVFYEKKEYTDWYSLFSDLTGDNLDDVSTSSLNQRVLRPDSKEYLFAVPLKKHRKSIQKFRESQSRIRVEIVYSSVFDEDYLMVSPTLVDNTKYSVTKYRDIESSQKTSL